VQPTPTGDPAKDIENSLAYQRDMNAWHEERYARATQQQNDILGKKADQELRLQQEEAQRRAAEEAAYQQRLAQQRQDIAAHTTARAAAIGDIESGKWRADKSAGGKITSILAQVLGGIGAGLSAAGGHPTGNLGQQAIDRVMDREYAHMQDRVNNENQAIQQARFGYRDAEDNHRAALNDLDADMAAKYKLVASDAEAQMRARGAAPEQIQQNEIVTGSLQKAAQYEDQIHAREIEAQRKSELAGSQIGRNNAQAEAAEALAGFRNRRNVNASARGTGGAGGGGTSKAAAKAQTQELKDIEAAAHQPTSVILGSARSQGVKPAYESAVAVSNELRAAAASGDPDRMKIAVMHAQEQSTRFLTGAAPTQQTFEIQHQLASTPEQLEAKLGGILGSPTEARSYVQRMAQNIDAIAKQRKEVLTKEVGSLQTRLNSIVKSDEGKRRMQGILDQFNVDGGATRKTQTMGGATYEFGDDGNWHKVK
jgi:hypothetical protein